MMGPMVSQATTVEEYLAEIPPERREAIETVRDLVNAHLPAGIEEGMQYGMIGWYVPHTRYPAGYHCDPKQPLPFVHLASQKNHMALYMFCLYGSTELMEKFQKRADELGVKLDVGKACIRFKKLAQIPLPAVAEVLDAIRLEAFIEQYESALPASKRR